MAQASRKNGKGRPRSRSGNAAHEPAVAAPARDYSIAAVGRALDLLEALSRIRAGSARGPGRRRAMHPHRRLPSVAHPGGTWFRDPGRGARHLAVGRSLGRPWPCGCRARCAGGHCHAVPRRIGQDQRGERIPSDPRRPGERDDRDLPTDPGLRVYSEVGKRQPLHAGSSRLLLAHAPEAVQTQVLAQRLPRFTPATRTDSRLDRRRPAAYSLPWLSAHH